MPSEYDDTSVSALPESQNSLVRECARLEQELADERNRGWMRRPETRQLIDHLTALLVVYEEAGDAVLSAASTQDAKQVLFQIKQTKLTLRAIEAIGRNIQQEGQPT